MDISFLHKTYYNDDNKAHCRRFIYSTWDVTIIYHEALIVSTEGAYGNSSLALPASRADPLQVPSALLALDQVALAANDP